MCICIKKKILSALFMTDMVAQTEKLRKNIICHLSMVISILDFNRFMIWKELIGQFNNY